MKNYKLNIHEFETFNKNKYIFDNNQGIVIPSSKEISYVVNNFQKPKETIVRDLEVKFGTQKSDAMSIYNYINDLISQGMFISQDSEVISCKNISYKDVLRSPSSQLVLILTEACNMRCKYCIYSDYYPGIKSYSNKEMSISTALKAVDKYILFHKEKQRMGILVEPSITFYGGEPFLKFDVIRAVINYCEQKNFKAKFFATTNGTIMSNEIIDYIIEKDIHVAFSLDGHKENHDRNRVLVNNSPTFELVFENIKKIQNKRNHVNKKQVLIFCVTLDLETDVEKIVNFFDENDALFSPYIVRYNKVADFGTNYYNNQDLKNNVLSKSFNKLYKKFYNMVSDEKSTKVTPALKSLYSSMFLVSYKQKFSGNDCKEMCIPGSKVAVSPDEKIYVCEKVNQSCPIGTLDEGLCLEKINSLANRFINIINENCKNCTVSRLCEMCYAQMICKDDLCFSETACKNTFSAIKNSLTTFYSLLENNEKIAETIFSEKNI